MLILFDHVIVIVICDHGFVRYLHCVVNIFANKVTVNINKYFLNYVEDIHKFA